MLPLTVEVKEASLAVILLTVDSLLGVIERHRMGDIESFCENPLPIKKKQYRQEAKEKIS